MVKNNLSEGHNTPALIIFADITSMTSMCLDL